MAIEPGARTAPVSVGIVAIFAGIEAEGPQIIGPMRLGLDDDGDAVARLLPGQRPLGRGTFAVGPKDEVDVDVISHDGFHKKCPARWPGELKNGTGRPAPPCMRSFRSDEVLPVFVFFSRCFLVVTVTGEEVGQSLDLAIGVGGRITIEIDQAQRFGQPAGIGQQALGFLGHVTLFQMVDKLRRPFARAFTHRSEDLGLGHATQIVLDRWPPSRIDHHIEAGGAGDPVGPGKATIKAMLRDAGGAMGVRTLIKRIDAIADAMGEKRHAACLVKCSDPVPERRFVGRQIGLPGVEALADRLDRLAVARSEPCEDRYLWRTETSRHPVGAE